MATNITLDNRTDTDFRLNTKPISNNWEPGSYEILATRAAAKRETPFLKLNRDEGITDGDIFLMGTSIEDPSRSDVCRLEEKLVGLTINSEIWAQIVGPDNTRTGWVADGKASLVFEHGGRQYRVSLVWVPTSYNDDLTYVIESAAA